MDWFHWFALPDLYLQALSCWTSLSLHFVNEQSTNNQSWQELFLSQAFEIAQFVGTFFVTIFILFYIFQKSTVDSFSGKCRISISFCVPIVSNTTKHCSLFKLNEYPCSSIPFRLPVCSFITSLVFSKIALSWPKTDSYLHNHWNHSFKTIHCILCPHFLF